MAHQLYSPIPYTVPLRSTSAIFSLFYEEEHAYVCYPQLTSYVNISALSNNCIVHYTTFESNECFWTRYMWQSEDSISGRQDSHFHILPLFQRFSPLFLLPPVLEHHVITVTSFHRFWILKQYSLYPHITFLQYCNIYEPGLSTHSAIPRARNSVQSDIFSTQKITFRPWINP